MSLSEKEKELLFKGFPEEIRDDQEFLLALSESIVSRPAPPSGAAQVEEERMKEAKLSLKKAIDATSALQKIIEQKHGKDASVRIEKKEVKNAMKRVFKIDTDEITFQQYKEAIAKMRAIANKVKEHVLNEQN